MSPQVTYPNYPSALPTPETTIGISVEATRGTGVNPVWWIPVDGPKYKPDISYLEDKALRGSMVEGYDWVPGQRFDSHGWDSYPYLDSFPNFLRGILGSADSQTGASNSTTVAAPAAVGATSISLAGSVAINSYLVVDTGVGTQETVYTTTGGSTPNIQYPLQFAHNVGASVTGLYKHQFSLLNHSNATGNQPPSYSITDYAGDAWRQITAGQLDELTISGTSDSLPKYTCTWMGNLAGTPTTPVAAYTTAEAPPGWTVQFAVGGTQINNLESWEFSLKRGVKNIPAIVGNQNYYQHFASVLTATAKFTVLGSTSEPLLSDYLNGTTSSLDLSFSDVSSGFICNLHSTKSKFTTGAIDRSKEWVETPLDAQLIPTTTDATPGGGLSPILATVGNLTTAAY